MPGSRSRRSLAVPHNDRHQQAESGSRVAHTLIACCQCRSRKVRCDPGLPRCSPCERKNLHCEYYDPAREVRIPRHYVVYLQDKVRQLEAELDALTEDSRQPDAEDLACGTAAVKIQESVESKYLGPSSGIGMSRIVMQLAKQFTDVKSISEIVSDTTVRHVKERNTQEELKPTSKLYPLISDVAAEELPPIELTRQLLALFNLKVQHMYPLFHEPTLANDIEAVYNESKDPYQNFVIRMVLAISLQKAELQYAGLADSYYLAALRYLEEILRYRNLKTLQCLGMIAEYSILTPTRTAAYYIVGLGVRLCQALGIHEERTVTRTRAGKRPDFLEVDMRRRLFWCFLIMEYGLSHTLGRPSTFAMSLEHIDVDWFASVADEHIKPSGIAPGTPRDPKKWIAIHFFKMRLLQLEIRRTLYQKKRSAPIDDQDPWFKQMETKLETWRDTSPHGGETTGLNKIWFKCRYNTMIVFLYRPSPQVPKPSTTAAVLAFEASQYNIHMQREQIKAGIIDLTWIFTQQIFMAINTILWALSYSKVRQKHPREKVEKVLQIALEAAEYASERWPGVNSAKELYEALIIPCMKIYEKDCDIPIAAMSPASTSSVPDQYGSSQTTSPATTSTKSIATPPDVSMYERNSSQPSVPSTRDSEQMSRKSHYPPPSQYQTTASAPAVEEGFASTFFHPGAVPTQNAIPDGKLDIDYNPKSAFNMLPDTFSDLMQWEVLQCVPQSNSGAMGVQNYNQPFAMNLDPFGSGGEWQTEAMLTASPSQSLPEPQASTANISDAQYATCLSQPYRSMDRTTFGLNHTQQNELMQTLKTNGLEHVEDMVKAEYRFLAELNRPRVEG